MNKLVDFEIMQNSYALRPKMVNIYCSCISFGSVSAFPLSIFIWFMIYFCVQIQGNDVDSTSVQWTLSHFRIADPQTNDACLT